MKKVKFWESKMAIVLLMEAILHQLTGSLSQYLQGFINPRWCRISSINSMFDELMFFYRNKGTCP